MWRIKTWTTSLKSFLLGQFEDRTDAGSSQRSQKAFMVVFKTDVEKRTLWSLQGLDKLLVWTVSRSPRDFRLTAKFVHKDGRMSSTRCLQAVSVLKETSSCWCWTVLNVCLEPQTDPGSEPRRLREPPTQVWFLTFNKNLKKYKPKRFSSSKQIHVQLRTSSSLSLFSFLVIALLLTL